MSQSNERLGSPAAKLPRYACPKVGNMTVDLEQRKKQNADRKAILRDWAGSVGGEFLQFMWQYKSVAVTMLTTH